MRNLRCYFSILARKIRWHYIFINIDVKAQNGRIRGFDDYDRCRINWQVYAILKFRIVMSSTSSSDQDPDRRMRVIFLDVKLIYFLSNTTSISCCRREFWISGYKINLFFIVIMENPRSCTGAAIYERGWIQKVELLGILNVQIFLCLIK